MGYVELEDGTRVYDHGKRYKPLSDEERVLRRRKPADAEERGAVRWRGDWLYPLPLQDEELRKMPFTRPDTEAVMHQLGCLCVQCRTVPWVRKTRKQRFRDGPKFVPPQTPKPRHPQVVEESG